MLTKQKNFVNCSAIRSELDMPKEQQCLSPLVGEMTSNCVTKLSYNEKMKTCAWKIARQCMVTIDPKDLIVYPFLKEVVIRWAAF